MHNIAVVPIICYFTIAKIFIVYVLVLWLYGISRHRVYKTHKVTLRGTPRARTCTEFGARVQRKRFSSELQLRLLYALWRYWLDRERRRHRLAKTETCPESLVKSQLCTIPRIFIVPTYCREEWTVNNSFIRWSLKL